MTDKMKRKEYIFVTLDWHSALESMCSYVANKSYDIILPAMYSSCVI
jgi:hypothetical protein